MLCRTAQVFRLSFLVSLFNPHPANMTLMLKQSHSLSTDAPGEKITRRAGAGTHGSGKTGGAQATVGSLAGEELHCCASGTNTTLKIWQPVAQRHFPGKQMSSWFYISVRLSSNKIQPPPNHTRTIYIVVSDTKSQHRSLPEPKTEPAHICGATVFHLN